ncbi:MAG: PhoP regulatory network protein YrbL [Akkermansiaceae bacterium]
MVYLDGKSMLGKGHHRECYIHPDDKTLCIKVIVDGSDDAPQTKREINYYKHLQRRGISWAMLPKYYGDVMTNMGKGTIFDLITDYDGSVSKTLEYYIASNKLTEADYDDFSDSLHLLKEYLLKEEIITMTLAPRNIVCQREQSGMVRLYVVDNIGNSDFIPLASHIHFLARKKIERRWERFETNLLKKYPENKAAHRIISKIRGEA